MVDDFLAAVFGEMVFGRITPSTRAKLLVRLCFGLIGAALGIVGAVHVSRRFSDLQNPAMRASMVAVFVFLACFSLFNVALGRQWRWPGALFVASFVSLFATRILFGA